MNTIPDITSFLADGNSYKGNFETVEIRETHISKVFLTDRFAYKLKKPVRFDFLDFSTPELRHAACEQEVQLNRRLAPDVYLGITPLRRDATGALSINGEGNTVDWLVKMRRLDDSMSLKSLIEDQRTCSRLVSQLADTLAKFYIGQAPQTLKSDEFPRTLENHIRSNRDDLLEHCGSCSNAINIAYSAQMRFLRLMSQLIENRVCDGRIVDGHGDLRPDHIYLTPTPVIIDCIEFNVEFRRNDIVDELSFLAMECERIGDNEIGPSVLKRYSELSGDIPPPQLIAFYKCYRACVRAKVAAIRSAQMGEKETQSHHQREAQSYLHLASRFAKQVSPPLIISVGGLMGTGKSTLADQVADELFAPLQRTDDLRCELFEDGGETLGFDEAKYSRSNRLSVYERMLGETPRLLESNTMVVVDGTFSLEAMRTICDKTARQYGCQRLHIECVCPRETSLSRVAERLSRPNGSTSEARPQLYDSQLEEYEAPIASANCIQVDTTKPLTNQIDSVAKAIRDICV